eukprot:TRINITY_DN67928_c0_g1_i1.p1 TRINITY_DN67928_c0_g1~~TRINITY_DN67928_c0_g1_i1.p1  ORF type:complete len:582 (-),score=247.09 TRINITY_DN67928_c0_g1_i1:177-1922(-)
MASQDELNAVNKLMQEALAPLFVAFLVLPPQQKRVMMRAVIDDVKRKLAANQDARRGMLGLCVAAPLSANARSSEEFRTLQREIEDERKSGVEVCRVDEMFSARHILDTLDQAARSRYFGNELISCAIDAGLNRLVGQQFAAIGGSEQPLDAGRDVAFLMSFLLECGLKETVKTQVVRDNAGMITIPRWRYCTSNGSKAIGLGTVRVSQSAELDRVVVLGSFEYPTKPMEWTLLHRVRGIVNSAYKTAVSLVQSHSGMNTLPDLCKSLIPPAHLTLLVRDKKTRLWYLCDRKHVGAAMVCISADQDQAGHSASAGIDDDEMKTEVNECSVTSVDLENKYDGTGDRVDSVDLPAVLFDTHTARLMNAGAQSGDSYRKLHLLSTLPQPDPHSCEGPKLLLRLEDGDTGSLTMGDLITAFEAQPDRYSPFNENCYSFVMGMLQQLRVGPIRKLVDQVARVYTMQHLHRLEQHAKPQDISAIWSTVNNNVWDRMFRATRSIVRSVVPHLRQANGNADNSWAERAPLLARLVNSVPRTQMGQLEDDIVDLLRSYLQPMRSYFESAARSSQPQAFKQVVNDLAKGDW